MTSLLRFFKPIFDTICPRDLIAYFLVSASSDSLPLGIQLAIRVYTNYEPIPRLLSLRRVSDNTPKAIFKPLVTLMLSSELLGLNNC